MKRTIGGMEVSPVGAPSSRTDLWPDVNVFLFDGTWERPGKSLLVCRTDGLSEIPEDVDVVLWTGSCDAESVHALDRFKVFGIAGDLSRQQLVASLHEAGVVAQTRAGRADQHRMRAIEVDISTANTAASLVPSQPWKFGDHSPLQCAQDVGWAGFAIPDFDAFADSAWAEVLGATGTELQFLFARSVPGVHVVWCGDRAEEALVWNQRPFLDAEVNLMLGPGGPHG